MDNSYNKVTNTGFAYDAAGPLPRFHRGGEAPNLTADGSATFTWKTEGRMVSTAGVTYTYYCDGQRVGLTTCGLAADSSLILTRVVVAHRVVVLFHPRSRIVKTRR